MMSTLVLKTKYLNKAHKYMDLVNQEHKKEILDEEHIISLLEEASGYFMLANELKKSLEVDEIIINIIINSQKDMLNMITFSIVMKYIEKCKLLNISISL